MLSMRDVDYVYIYTSLIIAVSLLLLYRNAWQSCFGRPTFLLGVHLFLSFKLLFDCFTHCKSFLSILTIFFPFL